MKLASILLSGLVFGQDPDERGKQQKKCENTPSECGQCLNMGTKSVEFCGFELRCLQLGFKNGECCSTKHPQTCQDCKALGDSCFKITIKKRHAKNLATKTKRPIVQVIVQLLFRQHAKSAKPLVRNAVRDKVSTRSVRSWSWVNSSKTSAPKIAALLKRTLNYLLVNSAKPSAR